MVLIRIDNGGNIIVSDHCSKCQEMLDKLNIKSYCVSPLEKS